MYDAQSRRQELAARVAMEQDRLARTRLTAAVGGVIVTPHLEERVGQNLARGAEFCVVADVGRVVAEVAVPEGDAAYLAPGQPAAVKVNPFPSRTFEGRVERVGARIREEGGVRFVVAEVSLANPEGALKTGMVGRAKITVGRHPIAVLLLRRPARWLYSRLWPLIP
jgi:multidrug efflux pump subunit AcrA (membrane-fusion protein)